jgi:hypothetical protein
VGVQTKSLCIPICALRVLRRGGCISGRFGNDPVEAPAVGDALQFMLARVLKDQTAPCYEVFHGSRDEDLRRPGLSRDPRTDAAVEVGLTPALGETESSRAGTVCETRGLTWKGMMLMHTRGMMGFAAGGMTGG